MLHSEAAWSEPGDAHRVGNEFGLYAYVAADPLNYTDPSGLDQLGLFCDGGSCVDIEITGGGSSEHGNYHGTRLGGGAGGRFLPRLIGEGGSALAGLLGNALDKFAEDHLKPPEDRKADESRQQCFKRITGLSHALAVAGSFNIAAGGAWLGYPRTGFAGGGGGTSLISSAARGAIGKVPMGSGVLGTGGVGGAIGRGLSRASVFTGAAAVGWAMGTVAGAGQKCQ
jgi:hypothetical protein